MTDFDQSAGEASDDDPPSGPPLSTEARAELVAEIIRLLWRIVYSSTQWGMKPLNDAIGLYCPEVKFTYYAVQPGSRGESFRLVNFRLNIDDQLHERTLSPLTDTELKELRTIAVYELKQRTQPTRKV